jgi:hypothetical protein
MASQPRTCAVCPASLDPRNRTGYCSRHHNGAPGKRQRISEALKRGHQLHPEWREDRRRAAIKAASCPVERARRAQRCRDRRLWEIGVAALTPESRAKQAAAQSARRMAWCPPELRDEAKRLVRYKKLRLAEVKQIIGEQHEAEMRRFRRSIGVIEDPVPKDGPVIGRPPIPQTGDPVEIIAAIASAFGLTADEITGGRRHNRLIPARQTTAYVLRGLGNSYRQVGVWLGGRDHSSVMEACRQFEARANAAMRELAEALVGGGA